MQLHYLTPAKHLLKNDLKTLENLINSLETENRCRLKRNQHPLTYTEAYVLLTQILGGDVLNACQSANIRYDVFTSATFEEGFISDDRNVGKRGGKGNRGRGNNNFQRGRGNRGGNSSGRAEALTGTMRGRTILSGPTVKTSILTAGVVHKTALRSIVVATS